MKHLIFILAIITLVSITFIVPLSAQPGRPENNVQVQTFFTSDADLDVDGDTGSYFLYGGQIEMEYGWLMADYVYRQYEWDDVALLPFGDGVSDPWEQLHKASAGISHDDMWSERFGYFFAAGVSAAFEEEMDDSLGFQSWAGLIYRLPSWNTIVRVGALYNWNEVTSSVLPILGIAWRNPGAVGFSAMIGIPLTSVTYRFSEQLAVQAGAAFDSETFRLADDSPVSAGGYLETENIGGEIALLFNLNSKTRMRLGTGGFLDRSLTFYDSDGNNGEEYDVDPGAFARVSLSFAF